MSVATTTERSVFLSTHVFDQDIPPTIADGIAELLKMDRQIITVTGKIDGRMSGFLADLTHCISRGGSLLRIKSALDPVEMHAALATQLHLPTANEGAVQIASRIGHRLQQPAPRGRFVLLCEAADQYPLPTLEAIRQISNYPVSIVLVGSHALTRRLRRASLKPLRQRITHQLSLNRYGLASWGWLAIILAVLAFAGYWYMQPSAEQRAFPEKEALPTRPISPMPVAEEQAPLPITPAPAVAEAGKVVAEMPSPAQATEPPSDKLELRLTMERELSTAPRRR